MNKLTVKIIADSVNECGDRLTTFEFRLTHASSRNFFTQYQNRSVCRTFHEAKTKYPDRRPEPNSITTAIAIAVFR